MGTVVGPEWSPNGPDIQGTRSRRHPNASVAEFLLGRTGATAPTSTSQPGTTQASSWRISPLNEFRMSLGRQLAVQHGP
jgi:hypothetical protein